MDLLLHMFDKNLMSHITWKRIKANDPELVRVLVSIAQNPRGKQSITSAVDIAEVGRDIGRNSNLRDLQLDDLHCLDHVDVTLSNWMYGLLCEGVNQNQSIEELTVSNFSTNQWKIGAFLSPFLSSNPNLRSVCVMTGGAYDTRSADKMRSLVSPLLERNSPLDELCFIETGVTDVMVVELADAFLGNPSLTPKKLQITACEFGVIGCQALAKLLKIRSCTMEILDLGDNCIDDNGAAYLAGALVRNSRVKEVSLEGNRITATGWKAFAPCVCYVRRQHEN